MGPKKTRRAVKVVEESDTDEIAVESKVSKAKPKVNKRQKDVNESSKNVRKKKSDIQEENSDTDELAVVNKVSKAKPKVNRKRQKEVNESNGDVKKKKNDIQEENSDTDEIAVESKVSKAKPKVNKRQKEVNESNENVRKKKSNIQEENSVSEKTVLIKGKAPVDPECVSKVNSAHVYFAGEDVWDCMLNQTNLEQNNNKYYIIQLLEDDGKKSYSVWMRWGRVGKKGQNSLVSCGSDLEKAKKVFQKKFTDKTKNDWEDRNNFEKVPGKYDLLKMDYNSKELESKKKSEVKVKELPPSTLHEKIKALMELIFNLQTMENIVAEMKYDANKAPLGKLTTEQIKAGYSALKKIEDLLNKNKPISAISKELTQACNEFYTRIPHDFGMKRPPLITNTEEIRQKIGLLETLGDIQIAIKMLNEESALLKHPVDRHYELLQCSLEPLEKGSKDFKIIEKYLQNTHATTHQHYTLTIEDIFSCQKETEEKKFKDYGNRMLLWHGSRLSNWAGILGKGLQIAPPEAPVTGYMFGKGIYFADRSSKSANYCYASRTQSTGLLLLCEVSLGTCNELLAANYNGNKLPKGKQSVKGVGSVIPDPADNATLSDGTIVPFGKSINSSGSGFSLNYNEYIVYNCNQVKMRYLVKVKFNFK